MYLSGASPPLPAPTWCQESHQQCGAGHTRNATEAAGPQRTFGRRPAGMQWQLWHGGAVGPGAYVSV
jgi:hypothetical protein